jgi:hypothetical protein
MGTRKPLQPLDASFLSVPVEEEAPKRKRVRHRDLTIDSFVDTYFKGNTVVKTLCAEAKEDDPPVIFAWRNVHAFVESIPHVDLPPPFALPQNPSEDEFKSALLNFVRVPGSLNPVALGVLPCTIHQSNQVCANLARLETNPWFMAVAAHNPHAVPIASVVSPVPRGNTVSVCIVSPPEAPCCLWGAL